MSQEPPYEVLQSYDNIQLRLYEPFLVAEVQCPGTRKEAIRCGFRILANYIFGDNVSHAKMPMSIPVTQQHIDHAWKIRFMLTHTSDLKDLPPPHHPLIQLLAIAGGKMAAIRFSGRAREEKFQRYTIQLKTFADAHQWSVNDRPILAFYNPPWTLPFLRRNEILFELL